MRVHPSILVPQGRKWQWPFLVAILLFVLLMNLFRGPREVVVAEQSPSKLIEVVVAQESIEAGQALETANLSFEQRPVNTVPADAITSFEAIKEKVAAGPIPMGYPLAMALLADPVELAAAINSSPIVTAPEDTLKLLMEEVKRDTVAMPITFRTDAPKEGSRIALSLVPRSKEEEPILVLEDAWISKSSQRRATLRVEPDRALVIQVAKKYGNFDFIEIPLEGASPYVDRGIYTVEELKDAVEGNKSVLATLTEGEVKKEKRSYRSYAWVSKEGIRYGIDDQGTIYKVDEDGKPLELAMPRGFSE